MPFPPPCFVVQLLVVALGFERLLHAPATTATSDGWGPRLLHQAVGQAADDLGNLHVMRIALCRLPPRTGVGTSHTMLLHDGSMPNGHSSGLQLGRYLAAWSDQCRF